MACATCNKEFDKPLNFPKDFPEEWMLCCLCRLYAIEISNYSLEGTIEKWGYLIRKAYIEKWLKVMLNIDKLITVVR